MRRPRVFLEGPAPAPGAAGVLDERAAHHLFRVLRRRAGDAVELVGADGRVVAAELEGSAREPGARALEELAPTAEPHPPIHLGQCLIKSDRLDWLLQKGTELGVAGIALLRSRRSEVRLTGERLEKRRRHWRGVTIAALEQSGRSRLPDLSVGDLDPWLEREAPTGTLRLVLAPGAPPAPWPPGARPDAVELLVGPEGGLAPEEVEAARDAGFLPWGLGPRVLRAETAPLAALAVLQFAFGDLGPGADADADAG
jgi:16S rRNA (uracil1498-N3)-methyltransferase